MTSFLPAGLTTPLTIPPDCGCCVVCPPALLCGGGRTLCVRFEETKSCCPGISGDCFGLVDFATLYELTGRLIPGPIPGCQMEQFGIVDGGTGRLTTPSIDATLDSDGNVKWGMTFLTRYCPADNTAGGFPIYPSYGDYEAFFDPAIPALFQSYVAALCAGEEVVIDFPRWTGDGGIWSGTIYPPPPAFVRVKIRLGPCSYYVEEEPSGEARPPILEPVEGP